MKGKPERKQAERKQLERRTSQRTFSIFQLSPDASVQIGEDEEEGEAPELSATYTAKLLEGSESIARFVNGLAGVPLTALGGTLGGTALARWEHLGRQISLVGNALAVAEGVFTKATGEVACQAVRHITHPPIWREHVTYHDNV